MTPERTPLCELERVTRSYGSGAPAVRDVSLDVGPGEMVLLVGPSGSGKTTLLTLIAGLLGPDAGTVRLFGEDLASCSPDRMQDIRARRIGFVFQTFQLIPTLTARENVQVPLELAGADDATDVATALLARVGLAERAHHYPVQLSGGEQQRVAVARAFSTRPRILFTDEPTGNLDAANGATVIDLMTALNVEYGTTLVLVTHDLDLAARARRTIRLADGAIVADTSR